MYEASHIRLAKSAPVKVTAFLYPDEGYVVIADEFLKFKGFCNHISRLDDVIEAHGKTFFELSNKLEHRGRGICKDIADAEAMYSSTNRILMAASR